MFSNKKTNIICILLCALCSCTACAASQDSPADGASSAGDSASLQEAVIEMTGEASAGQSGTGGTETAEEDLPEDADTVNLPAEDIAFLRFANYPHTETFTAPENERATVSQTFDLLTVETRASDTDTDVTALARKVAEHEYARERERAVWFENMTEAANEADGRFSAEQTAHISVLRADTRVLSYVVETTVSSENAPEDAEDAAYRCVSYNLDASGAKTLRLTDVVKDPEALCALAEEAILEKYDNSNPAYNAALQFEDTDLQKKLLALLKDANNEADGKFAWSPSYFGMRIIVSREALLDAKKLTDYLDEVAEINPRELKRFDVTIPYTASPDLFDPSFTELPVSYMARLETGVSYQIDFGNGLEAFQITAPRKYENNTVLYTGECIVRTGETNRQSFELVGMEEYGNLGVLAYLVKNDDTYFLYLDATGRGETDRLHVYAVADGEVRFIGVSEEMLDNDRMPPFDPAYFMAEGIFYVLPDPFVPTAYTGNRAFRVSYVSASGMPESESKHYEVAEEDIRKTAIELSLDTLPDADADIPVKETYPAGTLLSMWRIGRTSYADFKADDGRIVRMYINGVDTIDLIDGHELSEAFADPRLAE